MSLARISYGPEELWGGGDEGGGGGTRGMHEATGRNLFCDRDLGCGSSSPGSS